MEMSALVPATWNAYPVESLDGLPAEMGEGPQPTDGESTLPTALAPPATSAGQRSGVPTSPNVEPFRWHEFDDAPTVEPATGDVADEKTGEAEWELRFEFGRTRLEIDDLARLGSGTVVALENAAADPVDVYVKGRLVGRGEVVVINGAFGVRLVEIVRDDAI